MDRDALGYGAVDDRCLDERVRVLSVPEPMRSNVGCHAIVRECTWLSF
jgi:hypothetical protein